MAKIKIPKKRLALFFADLLNNKKSPRVRPKKTPMLSRNKFNGFVIVAFMCSSNI